MTSAINTSFQARKHKYCRKNKLTVWQLVPSSADLHNLKFGCSYTQSHRTSRIYEYWHSVPRFSCGRCHLVPSTGQVRLVIVANRHRFAPSQTLLTILENGKAFPAIKKKKSYRLSGNSDYKPRDGRSAVALKCSLFGGSSWTVAR